MTFEKFIDENRKKPMSLKVSDTDPLMVTITAGTARSAEKQQATFQVSRNLIAGKTLVIPKK